MIAKELRLTIMSKAIYYTIYTYILCNSQKPYVLYTYIIYTIKLKI